MNAKDELSNFYLFRVCKWRMCAYNINCICQKEPPVICAVTRPDAAPVYRPKVQEPVRQPEIVKPAKKGVLDRVKRFFKRRR